MKNSTLTPPTGRTSSKVEAPALPSPTDEVKKLAKETYLENRRMNAAASLHKKARKTLLEAMDALGLKNFEMKIKDEDGQPVDLLVDVDTPDTSFIDVAVLRKLVDEDTFLQIVSASKKAVTDHAGLNIVAKCEKTITAGGTRNVFVEALKK